MFTAEVLSDASRGFPHCTIGRKKRRPIYVRLDTNERLRRNRTNPITGPVLGAPCRTLPSEQPSKPFRPYPIRRCTTHIGPRHRRTRCGSCSAAQLGVAPFVFRSVDPAAHASAVEGVALAMQGESEHVIDALERCEPAVQQRFEEVASVRDRSSSLLSATTP